MLTLNIDYFKSKPVNIAKSTILLDHGYHVDYLLFGVGEGVSPDYDENQVWAVNKTLETGEGGAGKIWICPGCRSLGDWALKCLDGAL